MFTYKMVDLDIQKLFDAISQTRSVAYLTYINATQGDDRLAEIGLKELFDNIAKIKLLESELKIKISHLSR